MKTKLHPHNGGVGSALSDANLRRQIEQRAYELWLAAGRPNGEDQRHWLQAEKELLKEQGQVPKKGTSKL